MGGRLAIRAESIVALRERFIVDYPWEGESGTIYYTVVNHTA